MSHKLRKLANGTLLALVVVGTAACGGESATYSGTIVRSPEKLSTSASAEEPTPASFDYSRQSADLGMAAPTMTTGSAAAPATSGGVSAYQSAPGTDNTINTGTLLPGPNYQSPLTAGQVDDNAKFGDYMNYLQQYSGDTVHPVDVSERLFVRVVDGNQHPVAGARVQLYDGQNAVFDGRTVSDGRVLFFPAAANERQAQRYHAVVTRGNTKAEADIASDAPEATVTLDKLTDNTGAVALDLVFLLDATGSMDDEISQIKSTVGSIAERIEQLPGSSAPRFGLVAFRDRGDDYVTHSWDFTSDIKAFSDNLANVEADGGGDVPESVDAGLHDAINLPGWSSDESGKHLRMIVLVGDAPPHLDYDNDYEYTSLLQDAVQKGIKVFPIGASGLNDQGEYIFRQFAEITQGQFIFMTYANGVSGAPGVATQDHVSNFTVNNLDGMVVNLVAQEVANQTGQQIDNLGAQIVQPVSKPGVASLVAYAGGSTVGASLLNKAALWLQDAALQLSNWSTAFWLLLLAVLIYFADRSPQLARLTPWRKVHNSDLPAQQAAEEFATGPDLALPEQDQGAILTANRASQLQHTRPLASLNRQVTRVKVRS